MQFNLSNEYERQPFKDYVNDVYAKGKCVEVSIVRPPRTNQQNKYMHLIFGWFAIRFGYSVDDVKQLIFKRMVNADIFRKEIPNQWTGEMMESWKSTGELTTAELSEAITRFRNWSAFVAGLYLPSANEGESLNYINGEISKAKEYINTPQQ